MLKNFLDGFTSYGSALRLISQNGLWAYLFMPAIISIGVAIAVLVIAWGASDNIGDWLVSLWPWEAGMSWVVKIGDFFGGLLVLILGFFVFKQAVMVLSSPFLSLLSEKSENILRGRDTGLSFTFSQISSDIIRGLRIAIRNSIRELLFTLILLLIGLVPIFSIFSTAGIFVVQAYYAGFGNFDFALERQFRYRSSVRFVQQNRMLAIGNGTVFLLLLITVVGFAFALPLGTVAATIESVKRVPNNQ